MLPTGLMLHSTLIHVQKIGRWWQRSDSLLKGKQLPLNSWDWPVIKIYIRDWTCSFSCLQPSPLHARICVIWTSSLQFHFEKETLRMSNGVATKSCRSELQWLVTRRIRTHLSGIQIPLRSCSTQTTLRRVVLTSRASLLAVKCT